MAARESRVDPAANSELAGDDAGLAGRHDPIDVENSGRSRGYRATTTRSRIPHGDDHDRTCRCRPNAGDAYYARAARLAALDLGSYARGARHRAAEITENR